MSKIMLLEDDRDMSTLLQTLLEIEGYEVRNYDPQNPAVRQLEEFSPDVCLLDVHLGGQDGIEILRAMRQVPALSDLRVVMTSGINLTEECLEKGANAFIVKPYMPEYLLQLLKEVLAAPADSKHREENPKASSASFQKFL